MADLQKLINIGPRTEKVLCDIGIDTAEKLLAEDPYDVIDKIIANGVSPLHCKFILASIAGAHVNLPWHMVFEKTTKEYEKRHPGFEWSKH